MPRRRRITSKTPCWAARRGQRRRRSGTFPWLQPLDRPKCHAAVGQHESLCVSQENEYTALSSNSSSLNTRISNICPSDAASAVPVLTSARASPRAGRSWKAPATTRHPATTAASWSCSQTETTTTPARTPIRVAVSLATHIPNASVSPPSSCANVGGDNISSTHPCRSGTYTSGTLTVASEPFGIGQPDRRHGMARVLDANKHTPGGLWVVSGPDHKAQLDQTGHHGTPGQPRHGLRRGRLPTIYGPRRLGYVRPLLLRDQSGRHDLDNPRHLRHLRQRSDRHRLRLYELQHFADFAGRRRTAYIRFRSNTS